MQVFAARAAGGAVRVMVVNDDPATSYDLSLNMPGYHLTGAPVLFYGAPSRRHSSAVQTLTGAQARAAAATVPPYSITMLTLARG